MWLLRRKKASATIDCTRSFWCCWVFNKIRRPDWKTSVKDSKLLKSLPEIGVIIDAEKVEVCHRIPNKGRIKSAPDRQILERTQSSRSFCGNKAEHEEERPDEWVIFTAQLLVVHFRPSSQMEMKLQLMERRCFRKDQNRPVIEVLCTADVNGLYLKKSLSWQVDYLEKNLTFILHNMFFSKLICGHWIISDVKLAIIHQ